MKFSVLLFLFVSFFSQTILSRSEEERKGRKLYRRLAGKLPNQTEAKLIESMAKKGSWEEIAKLATDSDAFGRNLIQFAKSYSDKTYGGGIGHNLNDTSATIIGHILNDVNMKEILYGDRVYYFADVDNLEQPSPQNNSHYRRAEQIGAPLSNLKELKQTTEYYLGAQSRDIAGILTTRGFSEQFWNMGTNRKFIEMIGAEILCRPLTTLKIFSDVPTGHIGPDIPCDADGGLENGHETFKNDCAGCHRFLDTFREPVKHFDFVDGELKFLQAPAEKIYRSRNCKTARTSLGDRWKNYFQSFNKYPELGWPSKVEGEDMTNGRSIASLGKMFANTEAFPKCMSQKVLNYFCGYDFSKPDVKTRLEPHLENLKNYFKAQGYNFKKLANKATRFCLGLGESL